MGTKDIPLQIQVIAAPKYWIQTTIINFIEGEKIIQKALERIREYIEKHEGKFEILEAPSDHDNSDIFDNLVSKNNKVKASDMVEDNSEGIDIDLGEKHDN